MKVKIGLVSLLIAVLVTACGGAPQTQATPSLTPMSTTLPTLVRTPEPFVTPMVNLEPGDVLIIEILNTDGRIDARFLQAGDRIRYNYTDLPVGTFKAYVFPNHSTQQQNLLEGIAAMQIQVCKDLEGSGQKTFDAYFNAEQQPGQVGLSYKTYSCI